MEIYIYTPNFELVYDNGLIFINYIYQGIIQLTSYFNI